MNEDNDDKDENTDPSNDPPPAELEPTVIEPPPDEPKPPATVTDEPVEEPVFEHAYTSDPRNEIFARRNAQLQEEKDASDQLFDEAKAREADADPNALAKPPEGVKIRVYGEERVVPEDEVRRAGIATLQKDAAADQKLSRVAEREAELLRGEQRLLRVTENLRRGLDENGEPLVAAQPPTQGAASRTISKEKLESTAKGLYSGSIEESVAALQGFTEDILQSIGTATPASPEIVKSVEDAVLAKIDQRQQAETARQQADAAERDRLEANRIFNEDYKEITGDSDVFAMAKGLAVDLAADPAWAGKGRAAIAKEVGTRIRAKLPGLDATLTGRRAAKRDMSRSTAGGRQPPPPEQRFPSNKDYISQLQINSGSNSAPRR